MGQQSDFDLGDTVHDRHSLSPDDAVVVNSPDISISEFTAYYDGTEEVTVAADNPGYDPQQKVVIVVYQQVLDNFGGEYTGESPISFDALERNDIPYYGFPPARLVPDDDRYNTDPPASAGAPVLGTPAESIQRNQLELTVIDGVGTEGNRIATTDSGDEIYIGPAPGNPGDSIYIYPLGNSPSEAVHGVCIVHLETDNFGGFSAIAYLDAIASQSGVSGTKLEDRLSSVIEIEDSDTLVEYFDDGDQSSEPTDLDEESQSARQTESSSPAQDSESGAEIAQGNGATQDSNHSNVETESPGATSRQDLAELRTEARESGSENPSQIEKTDTQRETREYSRSAKVREYVKRRADGICEGCGEAAPFTSTTGEPYLEAHHIHELSDGGEDTVESVIALCPNCHYRVHHGQDGDEYNQELLEIVHNLENMN